MIAVAVSVAALLVAIAALGLMDRVTKEAVVALRELREAVCETPEAPDMPAVGKAVQISLAVNTDQRLVLLELGGTVARLSADDADQLAGLLYERARMVSDTGREA